MAVWPSPRQNGSGRKHALADVHNVRGAALATAARSSLGRIRRIDLGQKRTQVVVLAAAPTHVGHALHDECLHLLVREPLWRNIKKPPRRVQALLELELLLVVVAALEEAGHHHVLVVAVSRLRWKVLEVLLDLRRVEARRSRQA